MAWNDPATLRAEDVFAEIKRLALASPGWIAGYVAVLGGLGLASDYWDSGSGISFGLNIAQIAFEYGLTVKVMEAGGLLPNGLKRNFGGFFGLGIVAGLGQLLGLILLIVPGVILLIRWLPANGFLLAEGGGVTEALGRSWKATKPHFAAILVAAIAPMMCSAAAIGALLTPTYFPAFPLLASEIAGNLLAYGGSAAWTLLGLAVYALIVNTGEGVTEVFA